MVEAGRCLAAGTVALEATVMVAPGPQALSPKPEGARMWQGYANSFRDGRLQKDAESSWPRTPLLITQSRIFRISVVAPQARTCYILTRPLNDKPSI